MSSAGKYKIGKDGNVVEITNFRKNQHKSSSLNHQIRNHKVTSRDKKIMSARKIKDFDEREKQLLKNILKINSKKKRKMTNIRQRMGVSSLKFDRMVNSFVNHTAAGKKATMALKKVLSIEKKKKRINDLGNILYDPLILNADQEILNNFSQNYLSGYRKVVQSSNSSRKINNKEMGLVVKKIDLGDIEIKNDLGSIITPKKMKISQKLLNSNLASPLTSSK